MKRLIAAAVLAVLSVGAAAAEPQFADYPTKTYLKGKPVLPKFMGGTAEYRTRIRKGMKDGPNFAGHFSLIQIGCGESCRFAFLIDAGNGKVVDFEPGGEEYYQLQLKFGLDSTLLQADWMDTSVGNHDTCIRRFYDISSGKLRKVSEESRKIEEPGYCGE